MIERQKRKSAVRLKDLTPAEQEAAFRAEWERQNANLDGRHEDAVARSAQDPVGRTLKRSGLSPEGTAGRLYRAAYSFQGDFGLSALVLMAWTRWPIMFGLPGMENKHPSDNRVKAVLYGQRGLIARGLLTKTPDGLLRVAK